MEYVQLPTPNLPPVDYDRVVEELKCEVSIRKTCESYDARIANLLRDKMQSVSAESKYVVKELISDAKKLGSARNREAAKYEFELSKKRVEAHTLRQQLMTAHVNLTAAQDSLQHRERIALHLKIHLELDKQANRSQNQENAALRLKLNNLMNKIKGSQESYSQLYNQLISTKKSLANSEADLKELEGRLKMDDNRMQAELIAAQQRAIHAEEMLRQKDIVAKERARLQEDIKDYSNNLAKMALETGNAANVQLAETKAALRAEQQAKRTIELRLEQIEAQLAKAQGEVRGKTRRVANLEEALQQKEAATPAGARAVDAALNTVGAFVSDLGGSPESVQVARRRPAALGRRGNGHDMKKVQAPPVSENTPSDEEEEEVLPKKKNRAAAEPKRKRIDDDDKEEEERENSKRSAATTKQQKKALPKNKKKKTTGSVAATTKDNNGENIGIVDEDGGKENRLDDDDEASLGFKAPSIGGALQNNPLQAVTSGVVMPHQNDTTGGGGGGTITVPAKEVMKPLVQRPILGRVLGVPGGGMMMPGGGKRRLLGVSSSAVLGGDALPASMLFGNSFKVPKLQSAHGDTNSTHR